MNKNDYAQNQKPNKKNTEKFIRTNWKIKSQYCRVIEEGKTPRIISTRDAIEYAESQGLDLVEIGFDKNNNCSNCKVCDYSKFMYEQKKREKMIKKQARANQTEVKSLQLTLTTDVADRNRIVAHAREFLEAGDKVKIAVRFRNRREGENVKMAKDILLGICKEFNTFAVLDSNPTVNGKELACILRKA